MRGRYFSSALLKQLAPVRTPLGDGIRAAAAADGTQPTHDPLLEPRDEAVFLLTVAAEVEHALMVQYLYAAYSVRAPRATPPHELDRIQDLLFQIAREEMGHLATVQNLLHLIGGPLNFNREHSPYASELYPFRFKLEPLTPGSLAKYVIAESPLERPPRLPAQDRHLLDQLEVDAQHSNDGRPVNHVGVIFARLQRLFRGGDSGLLDEDFRLDRHQLQAKSEDWGYTPGRPSEGEALIIESFPAADATHLRSAAVAAVKKIGDQGEGFDLPPEPEEEEEEEEEESHFERFFDLYKRVKTLSDTGVRVTWPLTENANTTEAPRQPPNPAHMVDVVEEAYAARGRITHPRAKAWAQLFNLRYRLLLGHLSHFLRLSQELYVTEPEPHRGDRTARGFLLIWTFNEMRHLKRIAGKLVQLPRDEPPGDIHAGPPFELPYTLNLPDREEDRWRTHLDVSRASVRLVRERLLQPGDPTDQHDDFLKDLVASDEQVQDIMESLAAGTGVPQGRLPTDFHKAVVILEEAVRGFDVGRPHAHFWAEKTRDKFLQTTNPAPPVPKNPQGEFDFNPDRSQLIRRLEGTAQKQMPRFRPPVPVERIRFLRDWISRGAPDSVPAGEIGVHHERPPEQEPEKEPVPEAPPAPTTTPPLSFATDIRPLFRESPDREIMLKMGPFDLHRFEDVRDHADRILARLKLGDMPCDGSWPPDRVATFRKWIDDGKQP
jgi:Ferritin-like